MRNALLTNYKNIFLYENIDFKNIKFVSLTDEPNFVELFSDNTLLIRDIKDKTHKNLYRQLVLKSVPNEVESEVKLINIPEQDAKSITYKSVKTNKQNKGKKLRSCIEPNLVISHFIKVVLCSMHFLECSFIDERPLEVLVLGASIGTLPFFIKRVFNKFVKITAVEENEKLKDLGKEYFAFNTEEYEWKHSNTIKYIQSRVDHNLNTKQSTNNQQNNEQEIENKLTNKKKDKQNKSKVEEYDLVIINENSLNEGNKISPNKDYLTKEFLTSFKVRIKFS